MGFRKTQDKGTCDSCVAWYASTGTTFVEYMDAEKDVEAVTPSWCG